MKIETREVERLFADEPAFHTFVRKRDGRKGVEQCHLVMVDEWKRLRGGQEFSFMANSANEITPSRALQILTYEVGDLSKILVHSELYGEVGYLGDEKGAVADVLSVVRLFVELKGWDEGEVRKLGEERYLERQEDIRKHGKGDG